MTHDAANHVPRGYRRLEGSERRPAKDARRLGPAARSETFSVTVRVRRRPGAPDLPDHHHWMATPPHRRIFLTHADFANTYGAAKADLDAVAAFAHRHGMTVTATSVAGRNLVLSGTVEQMSRAFAVELGRYETEHGVYRGRDGFIYVPEELAGVVLAVFGLDNRPVGYHNGGDPPGTTGLSPTTVASFYNFPSGAPDASSQRIGVVEFMGGGWTSIDVQVTLTGWFATATTPTVIDVPPSGNSGTSDGESILDICTAAAVAPGATIQVYWGNDPTSAQDWFTVIDRIFHSPKAGDPPSPQVVSISWTLIGGDDFITPGGLVSTALVNEIDTAFQELAAAGITVFVASGDGGSLGWNNPVQLGPFPGAAGHAHVGFPASDPWVTACGGTTVGVTASFTLDEEWAWNDTNAGNDGATGGGVSGFFKTLPSWQVGIVTQKSVNDGISTGRGVPDVAGNASLNSGYTISQGSVSTTMTHFAGPVCGTSAVAPLYAGLTAMINARLGQSVGFLNPTFYAFRDSVFRDIDNKLFAGAPPDNALFGSPGYPSGAGWDGCTGLGVVDGGALLAALQGVFTPDCQFILDRTQFGKNEVQAALAVTTPALIQNAFYVVIDGFTAPQLKITAADLAGAPGVAPTFSSSLGGVSVVATSLLAEDPSLPANTPQRFTWICAASFPDASAFTTVPTSALLGASMAPTTGPTVSNSATVALVQEADPYEDDGPVSWLSQDLRVFQVSGTSPSLPGLPGVALQNTGVPATDAPKFITDVVNAFRANTTPPPNHPFDTISTDEQVSQVTIAEFDANALPVYNFAVARVRYQSTVASDLVRVFFRIFQASTTSTVYDTQTYAVVPQPTAGNKNTTKIPLFGVDGSGNVVAVPCFAAVRGPGPTLDKQTDPLNATTIPAGAGGAIVYTYFGCWLDINQPSVNVIPPAPVPVDFIGPFTPSQSVLGWIASLHQCLVAEISYDDDPAKAGQTPASSDKLAQRNLAIVPAANPGVVGSRRIPQTFDIRPTPVKLPAGARFDELMIDWGDTPAGSTAQIFLPGVDAAAVLQLAAKTYPTTRLTLADAQTLRCPAAGATWIPVPQAAGANFVGLLTVDLPPGIRKGQAYAIVVRQVTNAAPPAGGGDAAVPTHPFGRRVLGSFQITVPVDTKEALLGPAEQLLAIMRWIGEGRPPGDRYTPVFDRFLEQLAERVSGFGGDPSTILPSPTGLPQEPGEGGDEDEDDALRYAGKIVGLVYDHFGDFDGFVLETERHGDLTIRSREPAVERIADRAWRERIRVSVLVDADDRSRLVALVLRGPPLPSP